MPVTFQNESIHGRHNSHRIASQVHRNSEEYEPINDRQNYERSKKARGFSLPLIDVRFR